MKIEELKNVQENVLDYDTQMTFTLLRICLTNTKPVARLGVLFNKAGTICLYTCENAEMIIPEGEYRVIYTRSAKFSGLPTYKDLAEGLVPLLQYVPNREGIRIHIGNYADESRGCILVGAFPGYECVYKSKKGYTMLMQHAIKHGLHPICLKIVDVDSLGRYTVEEVIKHAEFIK